MVTPTMSEREPLTELALRSVVLEDHAGRVQALLPAEWLLDLQALNTATGRTLRALRPGRVAELVEKNELSLMEKPGLPGLFRLGTFIDSATDARELQLLLGEAGYNCSSAAFAISPEVLRRETSSPSGDQANIHESAQSFTRLRIRQRLDETLEIPALPLTAQRMIRLRTDSHAGVAELADIVEDDPSLAAQVISWAASPYYAAPGRIHSVQDAISRVLGFDLVSNLALGLAMGNTLSLPRDSSMSITTYWQQAVFCSTLVDALVRLMPPRKRPSQGLACLSGLLHNFGYLVLAHVFPPHFSLIERYIEANPHLSHVVIEEHLLQLTREQVSAWLMQLWNMPEEVCTALRFQHEADYCGDHAVYAHLNFIALRLLRENGIGDAPPDGIPRALLERYELDPLRVDEAVEQVLASDQELRKIAAGFEN